MSSPSSSSSSSSPFIKSCWIWQKNEDGVEDEEELLAAGEEHYSSPISTTTKKTTASTTPTFFGFDIDFQTTLQPMMFSSSTQTYSTYAYPKFIQRKFILIRPTVDFVQEDNSLALISGLFKNPHVPTNLQPLLAKKIHECAQFMLRTSQPPCLRRLLLRELEGEILGSAPGLLGRLSDEEHNHYLLSSQSHHDRNLLMVASINVVDFAYFEDENSFSFRYNNEEEEEEEEEEDYDDYTIGMDEGPPRGHRGKVITYSDKDCPIYLEPLGGTDVSILACGHVYHVSCLDKWFLTSRLCPYCRYDTLGAIDSSP